MAKGKTLCNVCGKEFSDYDEQEHIPQMEEFLKRAREDTTKYIVKELRKGGMQIRR